MEITTLRLRRSQRSLLASRRSSRAPDPNARLIERKVTHRVVRLLRPISVTTALVLKGWIKAVLSNAGQTFVCGEMVEMLMPLGQNPSHVGEFYFEHGLETFSGDFTTSRRYSTFSSVKAMRNATNIDHVGACGRFGSGRISARTSARLASGMTPGMANDYGRRRDQFSRRSFGFPTRISTVPNRCAVDVGSWRAPGVMAALARVVHDRQGAACAEHDHREDNQQGGLHGDLANAGPQQSKFNRGSNEPSVNAGA